MASTRNGSPEESYGAMAKNGRKPMGTEAYQGKAALGTGRAKLVAKKGAQAGDPAMQPSGPRKNVPVERNGAAYGVRVKYNAPVSPEAGATTANGRLFTSAVNRTNTNFEAGSQTSY